MAKIELTVRQIMNFGLWDKVCEYKGWEPYILNEGRISEDELVEFDDNFKKEKSLSTEEEIMAFIMSELDGSEDPKKVDELFEQKLRSLMDVLEHGPISEDADAIENFGVFARILFQRFDHR